MKRSKAQTRRDRHAARLHRLIESYRVDADAYTHRVPKPFSQWRLSEADLKAAVYSTFAITAAAKVRARLPLHDRSPARVTGMAMCAEVLPIAVSLTARGRRLGQMAAEFAENYNRVKHGDVI